MQKEVSKLMTKIDLISGFLGAGKTTLIKKLLEGAYPQEKLLLIENEFGQISIDSGFLKQAGVQVSEMSSGCICCSLVGDFGKALQEARQQFAPDRILIEPSGVGKLSDVMAAVEKTAGIAGHMILNSAVTVVDATKCKVYMKNFGEFFNNQVEHAQAILLSRTSRLSEEKIEAVMALLREHNPHAPILTTPWEQLSAAQIRAAMEQEPLLRIEAPDRWPREEGQGQTACSGHSRDCDCGGCGHYAAEVFTSWGMQTLRAFTRQQLAEVLTELESGRFGQVLRAKGIVPAAGGTWLHFDYVPGEQSIRIGTPDYSGRLCVIGTELDEEKMKRLFGG